MRKVTNLIASFLLIAGFISCSKDNNDSSNSSSSLAGNWIFTGLQAQTSATATDNSSGINSKVITTSTFTSTANTGTVNISGTTMTGNNIGYSANMLVFVSDFEDNVLDTFSTIVPVVVPPTSSTSTFEVIGKDSIHYTGGDAAPGSSGSQSPASTGAKFSISGDVLTLTSNVVVDEAESTTTQHETATVITTLKKQ